MPARSKGPFIALCAIVGIALGITAREIFTHRVTVTAADGTRMTIEVDPERIEAAAHADGSMEGVRDYGVSEKQSPDLPEGGGKEANLSGTKVR